MAMELHEAYEQLDQALHDGLVPQELHDHFQDNPDRPFLRPLRLASVAAKIGLWECSEVIRDDPELLASPFGREDKYTFLALDAADEGEFEKAKEYFDLSDLDQDSRDSLYTYKLIEHGRLGEAIELIRDVDFSVINEGTQINLARLSFKLSREEGGPRKALDFIKEIVPNPKNSDIEDKQMEFSRMDYFLEPIAPEAIGQNDFETAEEAVEMTNNWFGPPAAMGGGGLLDYAMKSKDKSVYPAIVTLIYRKWGRSNLRDVLQKNHENVRTPVKNRIVEWLKDIKSIEFEDSKTQSSHKEKISEINQLIELYTK